MKKVILMLVLCLGVFAEATSGKWYGRNTDKGGLTFNGIETKDFIKGKNEKVRVSLGVMANEFTGDLAGTGIIAITNKINKYNVSFIDISVGDSYVQTKSFMIQSDTISFRVNINEISEILGAMIRLSQNSPKEKVTIQVYDKNDKVILKLDSTLYNVVEAMRDNGNPEEEI